jgi:hypothetical protein
MDLNGQFVRRRHDHDLGRSLRRIDARKEGQQISQRLAGTRLRSQIRVLPGSERRDCGNLNGAGVGYLLFRERGDEFGWQERSANVMILISAARVTGQCDECGGAVAYHPNEKRVSRCRRTHVGEIRGRQQLLRAQMSDEVSHFETGQGAGSHGSQLRHDQSGRLVVGLDRLANLGGRVSHSRPSFNATDCCTPARTRVRVTNLFGTSLAVILVRSLNVTRAVPTVRSTSPTMSAPDAGPWGSTSVTKTPVGVFKCRAAARVGVIGCAEMPRYPRSTWPWASSSRTMPATVSAGMANPSPTDPPLGEKMADVTPTTLPSVVKRGRPSYRG